MKKYFIFLTVILTAFVCFFKLEAQNGKDPLVGIYKMGESSEMYFSFNHNSENTQEIVDIDPELDDWDEIDAGQTKSLDFRKSAAAKGDFNGDGKDEIVTVLNNSLGGIKITIPLINSDLTVSGKKEYEDDILTTADYYLIRICTGNFDNDTQDEFAIAFAQLNGNINICIFETDSALNIKLLSGNEDIYTAACKFDITSGDTDGDGKEEIIIVNYDDIPTEDIWGSYPYHISFVSNYDLYIMEYIDPLIYIKKMELNIVLKNNIELGECPIFNKDVHEIRITCGDIDNDRKDEILVGWSMGFILDWLGTKWTEHTTFLNVFFRNNKGDIENVTNHCFGGFIGDENELKANPALSLKCEKLGNLKGDQILISDYWEIVILTSNGENKNVYELKRMNLQNLKIDGNECFEIADLNPDTLNMDFKKEIIVLTSDINYYDQFGGLPSSSKLNVLFIDTIGYDILEFKSSTPIDLDNNEKNKISAFVAADFDMETARVFKVETPEIISVTDIQQPVVILNSPPVHFDVFDDNIYDLNNSFPPGNEYYASYFHGSSTEKTTSLSTEQSFGLSSDLRAYCFAAGTGFEASVTSNWQNGQAYYQSNSQESTIQNTRNAYVEDYLLCSVLNYEYYRYPVQRLIYGHASEKIGYLAVISPNSGLKMDWFDAASWQHPSYNFNHETGNVLSYKPFKNIPDIYNGASGSFNTNFDEVPISASTDGEFQFSFSDISASGSSFSFKSGMGADLFTKIGLELTFGTEIGFLGTGTFVQGDVKAGVSSEISGFYSNSSLNNFSTTISENFKINGIIGRLDESRHLDARYKVTPYIYRSQSGALVLDYMIDLDDNYMDWWTNYYGQKVDLAFILPWRNALEQGYTNVKHSQKQKTNEIRFFPTISSPGKTVSIIARVHNYSLMTFEGELPIKFYSGDPANGGIMIKDTIVNATMMRDASDPSLDFEEYISFLWQIPDTVTCSPRIYAVIDPDNTLDEIHKNNNTGWNKLYIYGCQECNYTEIITDIEKNYVNNFLIEAYPNPFSSFSYIHFSLPATENVIIELFNMSGIKVVTITDQLYSAGENEIRFDAKDLPDGVYFCTVSAGELHKTTKMILIR